jgi:hypothetical protein
MSVKSGNLAQVMEGGPFGLRWFTYIYVNRMIPVPDVSIGLLSEFGCVLFQRFKLALQNGAQYFPVALGS